MANNSLEQLSLHTIGGGWGAEIADTTNNIRVSVIRGTDIPRLRVGDFSSVPVRYESAAKVKSRLLKPGDIVVEVSGGSAASGQHTGRALLITQQMVESLGGNVIPASFCRLLRLDSRRVNSRFIVYQIDALHLSGEISEFENQSTGIANFQFTRFIQETYPCIEDLQTQSAIAHILGTLDDKIEHLRRQNETLEAMARALFKAWFVDFEPVRAKMEGRWQRGQSLPGLPAHLYDLFPDRLVESELGEIPEGWRVFSFGDVAQQGKGSVNPTDEPGERFTHYSIPAFDAGKMPVIELGGSIKSNKTPVSDGAVLVSKLNPHIPRVWLVGQAGNRAVCSTEFTVWTPKPPANSAFLYCLASSSEFVDSMCQLVTGTSNSHQRVKPDQLREIRVFAANENVIAGFTKIAESLMNQVLQNSLQSRTLAQLRDTLLPKLISGELRVPNAERIVSRLAQ